MPQLLHSMPSEIMVYIYAELNPPAPIFVCPLTNRPLNCWDLIKELY